MLFRVAVASKLGRCARNASNSANSVDQSIEGTAGICRTRKVGTLVSLCQVHPVIQPQSIPADHPNHPNQIWQAVLDNPKIGVVGTAPAEPTVIIGANHPVLVQLGVSSTP